MNIYIVTEGRTEQKIYESWIPLINANLTRVDQIEDVTINNFFLITGGGYPGYFEIIETVSYTHLTLPTKRIV